MATITGSIKHGYAIWHSGGVKVCSKLTDAITFARSVSDRYLIALANQPMRTYFRI